MAFDSVIFEVLNNKLLLALLGGAAFYLAFRAMFGSASRKSSTYHKEIERIINSDENKVKGRFEE